MTSPQERPRNWVDWAADIVAGVVVASIVVVAVAVVAAIVLLALDVVRWAAL